MAQQEKNIANGKDQKILQHDIEEIDKIALFKNYEFLDVGVTENVVKNNN